MEDLSLRLLFIIMAIFICIQHTWVLKSILYVQNSAFILSSFLYSSLRLAGAHFDTFEIFIYKTFAAPQLAGSVSPHFACSIWWQWLASDFGTSSRRVRSRDNLILILLNVMRSCSKDEVMVLLNNFFLEFNKNNWNKGLVCFHVICLCVHVKNSTL